MEKKKSGGNKKFLKKVRKNPFIISTIVLGLLVLILLFNIGGISKTISKDDAGNGLIAYLSAAGYDGFEVLDIERVGTMYQINTVYQGSEIPFYVTREGYIVGNKLISIVLEEKGDGSSSTEIPKSEVPEVELFIWGYCPYGVQAQGPLAEVAKLLGDYADFKAVLYYAGHGAYEAQQNKIQECVQQIAPDKYWDYASGFTEDIYSKCGSSKDIDCDKTESVKLMNSLGIDSSAVLSCVETQGDDLQAEASARASELGVSGSPSLVINGVKVSSSRTAEAYKQAVCSAFEEAPGVCDTELDSSSTTASGSC